jgi:hypothetical protein
MTRCDAQHLQLLRPSEYNGGMTNTSDKCPNCGRDGVFTEGSMMTDKASGDLTTEYTCHNKKCANFRRSWIRTERRHSPDSPHPLNRNGTV